MHRIDPTSLREEFPALQQRPGLVYLDSASTALRPRSVVEAVRTFASHDYAKPYRSAHALGETATRALEASRARVQRFLGAAETREIIFVRGTTEALNLVAATFGRAKVGPGDEILVTGLEHHSNLVPWQVLCQERHAVLRVAPLTSAGGVDLPALRELLSDRTRIVAVAHVSNALGTVLPIREIAKLARERSAWTVVDGAQAAPHLPVNVRELGVDFYAASGHKLYGPGGIGILYARAPLLDDVPPYQTGGDMVQSVKLESASYAELPWRFEAGTANVEGAVGLAAALDFLDGLGRDAVEAHEAELLERARGKLAEVPRVRLLGPEGECASLLAFDAEGVHPHDLATVLDQEGVAIRAGHLCAQPALRALGLAAAARASFGVFNSASDVDALAAAVGAACKAFR